MNFCARKACDGHKIRIGGVCQFNWEDGLCILSNSFETHAQGTSIQGAVSLNAVRSSGSYDTLPPMSMSGSVSLSISQSMISRDKDNIDR